jgi:methionyl-tRNA formyltransferase
MRVACIGYRTWALKIYTGLIESTNNTFLMIRDKNEISYTEFEAFKPELILFYGWSNYVPKEIIKKYTCLMLHPSPLPKFRGGSPIQNQIIRGITDSAVTIFRMNEEVDSGEIWASEYLNLDGGIADIFDRISEIGLRLSMKILNRDFQPYKQNDSESSFYPRRKPEESEITMKEVKQETGIYLFNKIRMLQYPYPNAFIKTKDGFKLRILKAELDLQ